MSGGAVTEVVEASDAVTPAKVFGSGTRVRVKSALEGYSSSRTNLRHVKHADLFGRDAMAVHPVTRRPLESQSQRDNAVCGAYFKVASTCANRGVPLLRELRPTEHDFAILEESMHEDDWTGVIGGQGDDMGARHLITNRKLRDFERKALLDDLVSGGLEAAPIVFDAAIITYPVLFGELFPLVETIPITRGRRVEGSIISNPTFTSGTAEGTSISLFDTSGFVSAFDNTVYPAVGAIEIGNDLQEDSPVNLGAIITQKYGEKAMEWLDNQIANGDGTSEPQGLFNSTGGTNIGNPAGGANAVPQTVDFEKLMFGVAKQYRKPADRARTVFVANDTSYQRARSIATATGWQTRAMGMDHYEYTVLGHSFKVQNDIANTVCGYCNLAYYRMYRRLGLNIRVETVGETLALKNVTCIVVRMRWAGKLTLGGAFAYSTTWGT